MLQWKKTAALLLAALLMLTPLAGNGFGKVFASQSVTVKTCAQTEELAPLGTLKVVLTLSEEISTRSFALDFSTAYDHDVFEWVSGQWSGALQFSAMTDVDPEHEVAAILNQTPVTAKGEIFTFTLRVKEGTPCETRSTVEVPVSGIDGVLTQGTEVFIGHCYEPICSDTCRLCGAVRGNAEHRYDDDCDISCNACGATRTPPHRYDSDGDEICNDCGQVRSVEYEIRTVLSASSLSVGDRVTVTVSLSKERSTKSFALDFLSAYDHDVFEWVSGDWLDTVQTSGVLTDVNEGAEAVFLSTEETAVPAGDLFRFVLQVKENPLCGESFSICVGVASIPNAVLTGSSVALVHGYDSECDERCNGCNALRTATAPHAYDDVSDESCNNCGQLRLAIYGTSLSLQHNFAVNFKVKAVLLEQYGDFCLDVVMNERTVKLTDYTNDGTYLSFRFAEIAPQKIGDAIIATLSATENGETVETDPYELGVKEYCMKALELYADDVHADFRTLIVDLLHYGARAQLYTGYKTAALADGDLSDVQRSWGTEGDPDLANHFVYDYATVDAPVATWYGAGLVLDTAVTLKLKFKAEQVDGLSVRIGIENGQTVTVSSSEFDYNASDGLYYLYFNGLNADQMSRKLELTVVDGAGEAVSNTVLYSIESYAYEKQNSTIPGLAELVKAMMNYGNAAVKYANA